MSPLWYAMSFINSKKSNSMSFGKLLEWFNQSAIKFKSSFKQIKKIIQMHSFKRISEIYRTTVSGQTYMIWYIPCIAFCSIRLSSWPEPRKQAETLCVDSLRHWSCIRLINGEITTTTFPVSNAGSWKQRDFPAWWDTHKPQLDSM